MFYRTIIEPPKRSRTHNSSRFCVSNLTHFYLYNPKAGLCCMNPRIQRHERSLRLGYIWKVHHPQLPHSLGQQEMVASADCWITPDSLRAARRSIRGPKLPHIFSRRIHRELKSNELLKKPDELTPCFIVHMLLCTCFSTCSSRLHMAYVDGWLAHCGLKGDDDEKDDKDRLRSDLGTHKTTPFWGIYTGMYGQF